MKKYGTLIWRFCVVLVLAIMLVVFIGKAEQTPIIICSILLVLNTIFFVVVLLKHLKENKQQQ